METLLAVLEVVGKILGTWFVVSLALGLVWAITFVSLNGWRPAIPRHRRPVGEHARGRS